MIKCGKRGRYGKRGMVTYREDGEKSLDILEDWTSDHTYIKPQPNNLCGT